jgi:hypothetical protein
MSDEVRHLNIELNDLPIFYGQQLDADVRTASRSRWRG